MLKIKLLYIFFIGFLLMSCNVNKILVDTPHVSSPLPKQFNNNTDTLAINAIPSTQAFFADTTLRALIDSAFNNNFDIQESLQRIAIAGASVRFNKGTGKPDLSANISVGQRKFGKYTIDGVGNFDTNFSNNIDDKQKIPSPIIPDVYLGLQSSWEIDLWGKLKNYRTAAAARLLAGEEGRNLVKSELVAQVASTYYDLLILDNELDFLQENINLQEKALEIVKVLKQAGEANQLGVDLMQAQLLSSNALKIEVKQEIIQAESKINYLLGRFPQTIQRNKVPWATVIPPSLHAGIPSKLLENRPDIRQRELEIRMQNANVSAAKLAFFPSLNITGGIGFQSFRPLLILNPASIASNTFSGLVAPLANRRQLISDLMTADAEKKIAYINYQKSVVNAFMEVYNHLNMIENMNKVYELKNTEVEVLKQSINTSAELFKSGRATYLEVITAQKNALQSQIELINIKKQQYAAVIGLYKSLGGGWK